MAIRALETSRLGYSRLLKLDDVEHWELPEYPEIAPAGDDIIYEVKRTDRIDNIANAFYGTATLWWVIALANNFRLLPNDLAEVKEIRVPSPRRVTGTILRKANRGREGK